VAAIPESLREALERRAEADILPDILNEIIFELHDFEIDCWKFRQKLLHFLTLIDAHPMPAGAEFDRMFSRSLKPGY